MALSGTDAYASYDITDGSQERDISPLLLASLHAEEGFLDVIGVGGEVNDTLFYWTEEALNPFQVVTDTNTYTAGATSITLASGHGGRVRVGSILNTRTSGTMERIQVIGISTDTLTVVRGYGGSTAEALTASQTLDIQGNPLQEGSDVQTDVTVSQTVHTNVTQIFERSVVVTRNQRERKMASIQNFPAHSLEQRTIEVKRELNLAALYGIANSTAATGSDTQYRSMNGLDAFVNTASSNTRVTTSENQTAKVFSNLVKKILDTGHPGSNLKAIVGFAQRQKISAFDESIRRRSESSTRAGGYVESVLTDLGVEVPVVTDFYVHPDKLYIVDTSRISLRPFVNSRWTILAAPTLVDGTKRRIIGEWSLEVRNKNDAHAVHTNLQTT